RPDEDGGEGAEDDEGGDRACADAGGRVVAGTGGGGTAGPALVGRRLRRRDERSADLDHPRAGSLSGFALRPRDIARGDEAAGDLDSVVRGGLADRYGNGRGSNAYCGQLGDSMRFHPAPFAVSCDLEQDGEAAILLPAAKMWADIRRRPGFDVVGS